MRRAATHGVRVTTLARRALPLLVSGCVGSASPALMHEMTSLPDERPQQRDERLDSARARPEPETRKRQSKKERQVETAAATLAAITGMLLSSSQNVMIGTSAAVDENLLVDPGYRDRKPKKDEDEEAPRYDPNQL